jgi:hypothetical protein
MAPEVATMPNDIANRLTKKLKLQQTPGKDVMKKFANRARTLQDQGLSADQAALKAAHEIFPAEFMPTRYNTQGESMEAILTDIEKL